jgi:lipoprotein NlpD
VRRALATLLLAATLAGGLAACGGQRPRPAPPQYVVRAGDTLYSIGWRHRLDYRELARWNGIGGDYRIAVGQVLRLTPPAAGAGHPAAALPVPPSTPPPHFGWPTDGRDAALVHQPQGGIGLRIAGAAGDEVRAAAAGRVVYVGSGLRAYGRLVIVKHDDTWLSAYGCNREVYVNEGETVAGGQRIAAMGLGPDGQPQLYFEIRAGGRPVDPEAALPRR